MQLLPAKKQEESCTVRSFKGLRNQNGEHLVNQCESNNIETYVIVMNYPKLYFLLKVQVTRHKVIGDGCIWERI